MNAPIDARFSLVDQHGLNVTERDLHGKWSLVFFGFTHCRVVCPRALQRLSDALELLDPGDRQAIRPVYITVDPERDTPEVMKAFLSSRPGFVGFTGTRAQIDAAKESFRVFAEKRPDPQDPDGYAVPHTAITYVIAPDGRYADHFTDALDVDQVAGELRGLLHA